MEEQVIDQGAADKEKRHDQHDKQYRVAQEEKEQVGYACKPSSGKDGPEGGDAFE